VRFILRMGTSSHQPSWLVLSAINMVSLGCNDAVVVDRGHKFSSGLSEICFWIKRAPFAFSADAVAFVPGVLVTEVAASVAGEQCTTAGTEIPSGTVMSSKSQSLHSDAVPLAFVNELVDSFVAVCSGTGASVSELKSAIAAAIAVGSAATPAVAPAKPIGISACDGESSPFGDSLTGVLGPGLAAVGPAAGAPRDVDSIITSSTVLDPTSVLPDSMSTSSSTVFGIGSVVWVHGLTSRPELNSCMGTIVAALAGDGRYGVRVEGSCLFGRPSADVRIRSANVRGTLFGAKKTC
jgi:hypothetical protein